MAILRKNKKSDYTIIDNNIFKNKKLSLKAKGMICTMLSLPDGWEFSEDGLTTLSTDGKDSIRSTLKELMEYGYLVRSRNRDEKGILRDTIYTIHEEPTLENPNLDKPILDKPILENPNTYKILNDKILNNKIINKEEYKEEFERLWNLYPNKKGKKDAYNKFIKAIKNGTTIQQIENGINKYNEYIKITNTKDRYIKHGSSWFNQECWNDDYTIKEEITTRHIASKIDFSDFINKGVKNE